MGAQGNGDAEAQKHVFALARLADIETRFIELVVNFCKSRPVVPLDQIVFKPVVFNEVLELKRFRLGRPVQTENNGGKIGDAFELLQYVFEYGQVGRIRILTGKKRDNEDGLLPPGMQSELVFQMFSVLAKDVEGGDLTAVL